MRIVLHNTQVAAYSIHVCCGVGCCVVFVYVKILVGNSTKTLLYLITKQGV